MLRLQYPYDPTLDVDKKIYFNRTPFVATFYTGGEFGITEHYDYYITTPEMTIDYTYFN